MPIALNLLVVLFIAFSYYKLSGVPVTNNEILSQFIAMKGGDKWVVAELNTTEYIHRNSSFKYLDIPLQYADLNLTLQVSFNYYLKLTELDFKMVGDSIMFRVPDLYLVTPVAFESASFKPICHASWFSSCKSIQAELMLVLSTELASKGREQIPSIYDVAAKALADNFYQFAKAGKLDRQFKTVTVKFEKEGGPSQRMFNY